MYELLAGLLTDEFGIEAERVTPEASLRGLELDSLALAELSVMVSEETSVRVTDVDLDSTLGELAQRFETAAASPAPASA
ncbi:acyl carrier protein [Streptomyces sp. NPDC015131]|uniref:acyl carrier protein n=1 Tax=Streptomyces sp. NPDC015131 TaxID=3364941 RepID=UPI0036FD5951